MAFPGTYDFFAIGVLLLSAAAWCTVGAQRAGASRVGAFQPNAKPAWPGPSVEIVVNGRRLQADRGAAEGRAFFNASDAVYIASADASTVGAPDQRPPGVKTGRPSAVPYVVSGAVIGAVAMVGALLIYYQQSDTESLTPAVALAPAVAAGGAVGAAAGWLVFRLRHR